MKTKLTRATKEQKALYTNSTYPLWGYATLDGLVLVVEDLRASWSKDDPSYEVMAPSGCHFAPDFTQSLLCDDINDMKMRLQCVSLQLCGDSCGDYNQKGE